MTKALRELAAELKNVDAVIYVLDARAPISSINPQLDEILGTKKRLFVLNKKDLIAKDDEQRFVKYFEDEGFTCIAADSGNKSEAKKIIAKLAELNAPDIARYAAKGVKKIIRAEVVGVPNSGKSTMINSLLPRAKAKTGDKPGVTRGKQWISVTPHIELLDTPGVLYPDFSDETKAFKLALLGSIKDERYDDTEIAVQALSLFMKKYPQEVCKRFNISAEKGNYLESIAVSRGLMMKGGIPDIEKAAKTVITDFRSGLIGKISLD
jgi:ribosome biogenesis GTPase A